MISHIQQQARKTAELLEAESFSDRPHSYIQVLVEELDRLNPCDFLTAFRSDFVEARRRVRRAEEITGSDWRFLTKVVNHEERPDSDGALRLHRIADLLEIPESCRRQVAMPNSAWADARQFIKFGVTLLNDLAKLLGEGYGGEGSHIETRSFAWVKNANLRRIVERDYKELMLKVYPSGAWKMAVVAAGSILEAVVYDQLTRSGYRAKKAMRYAHAPKNKGGTAVRDIRKNKGEDKWDLEPMIGAATWMKILPEERSRAIDQTLRDWRNFVHPHKELKADYEITDAEAETAVGNLKCVCNHLEKKAK